MALRLSEEESASLDNFLAKYLERANYPITLDLLLDKWKTFVSWVESGYSDSIYEYKNDLSTRTILQEIVSDLGESLGDRLSGELRPWDERFTKATIEASKPFHPDQEIEEYPWVSRIPISMTEEFSNELLEEGYI